MWRSGAATLLWRVALMMIGPSGQCQMSPFQMVWILWYVSC